MRIADVGAFDPSVSVPANLGLPCDSGRPPPQQEPALMPQSRLLRWHLRSARSDGERKFKGVAAGGSIVDDDDFIGDLWIGVAPDAIETLRRELELVEDRNDDRNVNRPGCRSQGGRCQESNYATTKSLLASPRARVRF